MANAHREYVLEVFSDQNFVRDIVKGESIQSSLLHGKMVLERDRLGARITV